MAWRQPFSNFKLTVCTACTAPQPLVKSVVVKIGLIAPSSETNAETHPIYRRAPSILPPLKISLTTAANTKGSTPIHNHVPRQRPPPPPRHRISFPTHPIQSSSGLRPSAERSEEHTSELQSRF